MKGLLLKDFLYVCSNMKSYLFVFVIYFALTFMQKSVDLLGILVAILTVNMLMSCMAFDDKVGWARYALTTPISKRDIVFERYLFSVFTFLAFAAVSLLVSYAASFFIDGFDMVYTFYYMGGIFMAMLLIISISIPLIFKYGVEKIRVILMLFALLPLLILFFVNRLGSSKMNFSNFDAILPYLPVILFFFVLLLVFVSYKISLSIFHKKDF